MNEDIWHRSPGAIARALLGKTIVIGSTEATVLQARGYGRAENASDGLYAPLLEAEPGSVYCPRRHNAVLLLFATADRGAWGGCVLVRTIESDGVVYEGPGSVTERLGIRAHAVRGSSALSEDEDSILLQLEGAAPSVQRRKRERPVAAPGNGVGEETLSRLMPRIVAAYLRERPVGCSFHGFINRLLRECATASQLRRRLTTDSVSTAR